MHCSLRSSATLALVLLAASAARAGCSTPPCADCTGDGVVSTGDLNAALSQFGGPGGCDFNGNGIVDWEDIQLIQSQLGQSCPPALPAPPASAFELSSVDLGVGGVLFGLPIINAAGQTFFQHPAGGVNPPTSALVAAIPELEFDSYVAKGGLPTTTTTQATAPVPPAAAAVFAMPAQLRDHWGSGFTPSQFILTPSGVYRLSRNQVVFMARLTAPVGASFTGQRVRAFLRDALGYHAVELTLGGPSVTVDTEGCPTAVPYRARAYGTETVMLGGSAALWQVCDVFIEGGPHTHSVYGDDDNDCFVGFSDLNNVLSFYQQSGPNIPGDIDDDGIVTFGDLNIVLSNWACRCADTWTPVD